MKKLFYGLLLIGICWLPVSAQTSLLDEAQERVAIGDYEGALERYDEYLADNPDDAEVYGFRALAHIALTDLDAALADIELGLNHAEPELAARLLVLRAEFHIRDEEVAAALADYDAALEQNPDYALAYMNRGLVYETLGDYDPALADYGAVIDLLPEEVNVYLRRGRLYIELDEADAAIADFTTAIDLEPENPEAYILRAHVRLGLEAWSAAAADYADWLAHIETARESHRDLTGGANRRLTMAFGQIHEVSFRGVAGQRLTVSATSRRVDALLVLLGPDGTPLFADDDGGEGLNALITDFALPETGTYTLIVGHARGGWDGTIALSISLAEIL